MTIRDRWPYTTGNGETGSETSRFFDADDLHQEQWWTTEELLVERRALLKALKYEELDARSVALAPHGRGFFLEELKRLDAELERRALRAAERLRREVRGRYSREEALMMARMNERISLDELLERYGSRMVTRHGQVMTACPLPGHRSGEQTFVLDGRNGWECASCGQRGSVYELGQLMAGVGPFQAVLREMAGVAGIGQ